MPASSTRKTTAAKRTPAKKTAAHRDTPVAVGFNFDTWARGEELEPFATVIGGTRYESIDPAGVDFRDVAAAMDDPERIIQLLFPDDHEEILGNQIPLGALAQFSAAIFTHFELEDFVAAQS